jgi:hypothetical protein
VYNVDDIDVRRADKGNKLSKKTFLTFAKVFDKNLECFLLQHSLT